MDVSWNPGADGEVTDNELTFMLIHAMADCVDYHDALGHNDWGAANGCGGGTTRGTDPSPIQIDGIALRQDPGEIPEGGIAQVLAHEFNHQVFGLPDLYRNNDHNECNPKLIIRDGNVCYPCKIDDENPEAACNNDCGGSQIDSDCTSPISLSVLLAGGGTYWIRVSGNDGDTGTYKLNIQGGLGECDHPRDGKWWPQLAGPMTIMKTGWTYMPHMSPWANMHLGFTRPNFLMDDGTNTLHRAETIRSSTEQISQPEPIVISNFSLGDFSKEYFILENRAPVNLIGVGTIDEGLALWLVHEDPPFPGDGSLVPRRALQLMRPQIWAGGMDCSGTAASRTTTICRPRRRRRTPTGRTVHRAISTSETSRPPVQR